MNLKNLDNQTSIIVNNNNNNADISKETMLESNKISKRWDQEYLMGRYEKESPIEYVKKIRNTLEENPEISKGRGLYIGCGNGRNYIPLADSGLNVMGVDISHVAIEKLSRKIPTHLDKLTCIDFLEFNSKELFDYIISIQVFQHGAEEKISRYFDKASKLLKKSGLLFLRVNSNSTKIYFKHSIVERNDLGGYTVLYRDGPKKDLYVHFFSLKELEKLCKDFRHVSKPYEDKTLRVLPKTGIWSQWDLIMQKK